MATEAFTDFVVGHGELWCALLFSATVKSMGYDCKFMDTRDVLVVIPTSGDNSVDPQYEASNAKLDAWVQSNGVPEIIVATGFIAKNPLGQASPLSTTTILIAFDLHAAPCNWLQATYSYMQLAVICMQLHSGGSYLHAAACKITWDASSMKQHRLPTGQVKVAKCTVLWKASICVVQLILHAFLHNSSAPFALVIGICWALLTLQ